jgi:AraC-like DNA-binding protein
VPRARIADELGVSPSTITRHARRLGFPDMRGELVPRTRAKGELSRATRDRVEDLLARGGSQAAICRELGLSKSTVAYHARQLGHRADPRFARRYDWAEIQAAIAAEGLSMRGAIARFGFCAETWRQAVERGDIVLRPHRIPIGSSWSSAERLRGEPTSSRV